MKKNLRGIISIFVIMFMFIFLIACDLSNNSNIETLNVTFEDKTFTYDGNIHNIDINGILPEGVTVEYYYNGSKFDGIKEPGTYTIVAKFTDTTGKYKLNDLVANITIKEKEVSIDFDTDLIYGTTETYEFDGVRRWGNVNFDEKLGISIIKDIKVDYYYQGKEFYGAMLPGKYEIIGKVYYKDVFIKEVPTELIIEYNEETAKNLFTYEDITTTYNGNVIYFEAQTNVRDLKFDYYSNDATYAFAIEPGEYVFNLVFVDALTGEKFDPNISKKLTILPLEDNELDLSDYPEIYFKTVTIDYDGNYQMINLTGDDVYNLPDYVLVEYYCNGELFDGASECGIYDIQAILTTKTKTNYYGSFNARMTIRKTFDISNITYNDRNITYDGNERNIVIKGRVPEDLDVIYYKIDDPSILNGIKPNQISKLNLEQLNIPTVKDPGDYYFVASFVPNVQYQIMTYPNYMICHVNVSQVDFDANLVSFEDKSVIYDGSLKNIIIENLPDNFEISYYLDDESFAGAVNAGIYNIKAVITDTSGIYKNIPDFYATLKIYKANYNMNNIRFDNRTSIYDGLEKELLISGSLPNGLTVEYENNKLTNAGSITATAKFINSNPNYENVSNMTATLTIEKASVYGITFESHSYVYDGLEHNILIGGNLPDGVSVNYYCNDSIFTGATNANNYYITAKFTDSTGNYSVPFDMTASLNISKARYDMSNIYFKDHYYTYDGSEKELLIDGTLPSGLTAVYENNKLTDVGYVRAIVSFVSNNPNYEEVQHKEAYLVIEKAKIGDISFKNQTITYDGKVHNIAIEGTLPNGVLVNYYFDDEVFEGATNVGWYGVDAKFTDTTGNYKNLDNLHAVLIINKATISQTIEFNSETYTYDGSIKNIEIETYITDETGGKIQSELPKEIEVEYYFNNNKFKGTAHAGVYEIEARFINKTDNFNPINSIFATLTIESIDYDLSTFSFNSVEYIYDGLEKELTIIGTLPEGLNVFYSENKLNNAGSIEVYAYFWNNDTNYNDVETMSATLTIKPKKISGYKFESKEYTYNGETYYLNVEGDLPEDVYVKYSCDDNYFDGAWISGKYEIEAILCDEFGNYEFEENNLKATLTINKASYDMSNIKFESLTTTYDAWYNSIYISGDLNPNLSVKYENNAQMNAGVYEVVANFINNNQNYNTPEPMKATLTILKRNYSEVVNLQTNTTVGYYYCGEFIAVPFDFSRNGVIATNYYNNEIFEGAINAGTYNVITHFEDPTGNYNVPEDITNTFIINKIDYDLNIRFLDASYEYDGLEHSIEIEGVLPEGLSVIYSNNSLKEIGEVEAKASFINSNNNYNDINYSLYAKLTIKPQNIGLNYYYDEVNNYYVIIGDGSYKDEILNIPSAVNDKPIGAISGQFKGSLFKTVILPEGIVSIGYSTFAECDNLENFYIPSTLVSINDEAFDDCPNLENVYYKGTIHDWFKINISYEGNPMKYASNFYEYDETNSIICEEDVYTKLYRVKFDENYTKILTKWHLGYFNLSFIELNDNITEIEYQAFANCTKLQSISLPNSLISIGSYAFANCRSITSVIVPNSVQTIGTGAFSGCVNLEFIKLPFVGEQRLTDESELCYPFGHIFTSYEEFGEFNAEEFNNVTQLVKSDNGFHTIQCYIPKKLTYIEVTDMKIIPFGAFSYLDTIETIKINNEVEIIEQWAFIDCKNIKTFEIPSELISIGKSAFENCTNLYNISVNKTIETIGESAFSNCTSLKDVILPESLKIIGERAFLNCSINVIELPESLEYLGNYAFANNNIKKAIIPDNVISNPSGVFYSNPLETAYIPSHCYNAVNQESLKSLYITSGKNIESYAFRNCINLTRLTLCETIEEIGIGAFTECYKLIEVCNLSKVPSTIGTSENGAYGQWVINYSDTKDYESIIRISGDYEYFVRENKCHIFCYNGKNSTLTIPDKIYDSKDEKYYDTYIYQYAFYRNEYIQEVIISENISEIGYGAFSRCSNLVKVTLPSTLEKLDNQVFEYDYKLIELFNFSNINIEAMTNNHYGLDYLLKVHTKIEDSSIIIENGYHFIESLDGYYLINYDGDETDLVLPLKIKGNSYNIAKYAFWENENITSIVIPYGTTYIGDSAFNLSTRIKYFSLPKTIEIIGSNAFTGCNGIEFIDLNLNLTEIEHGTFAGAHNLKSIVISKTIVYVGNQVFMSTEELENVYYAGTKEDADTMVIEEYDNETFINATWYYFTENGENETEVGKWWYYDTDGTTIIEKIIE